MSSKIKGFVHKAVTADNFDECCIYRDTAAYRVPATLIIHDGDEPRVARYFDGFISNASIVNADNLMTRKMIFRLDRDEHRDVPARLQILEEPKPEHKPCGTPRCGSATAVVNVAWAEKKMWAVECQRCGLRGPCAVDEAGAWSAWDNLPRRER